MIRTKRWYGGSRFDFAEEIDRGVAVLDGKLPGWERLIDVDKLDLHSTQWCVLAQIAKVQWPTSCEQGARTPFSVGARRLGVEHRKRCGFTLPDEIGPLEALAWRQLTRQWKRRIEALRVERAPQQESYALAR